MTIVFGSAVLEFVENCSNSLRGMVRGLSTSNAYYRHALQTSINAKTKCAQKPKGIDVQHGLLMQFDGLTRAELTERGALLYRKWTLGNDKLAVRLKAEAKVGYKDYVSS
jgi:hypothetical protein